MLSFGLEVAALVVIGSILLCVHVVKTGRELYWLFIILLFMPIGGLVYLVAIVLPDVLRGDAVRKAQAAARETLDPHRAYREAKAAMDDSPTVNNRMRHAAAAGEIGRWEEAESLYREAAQGVHADDPALLQGRAQALVELERYDEALPLLQALHADSDRARTPQSGLAEARALEGVGRTAEAEAAYRWAAGRVPGLEGLARQAAFLARNGRSDEARELLVEIEARLKRANKHFQAEGRRWRDLAAREVR